MGWFSRKTSIAGTEFPNWVLVVVAIVGNLAYLQIRRIGRTRIAPSLAPARRHMTLVTTRSFRGKT